MFPQKNSNFYKSRMQYGTEVDEDPDLVHEVKYLDRAKRCMEM